MMYSFGSRSDCVASDEPFYGAFLKTSGIDHPMRELILASMETDPEAVATSLSGSNPDGAAHWYQKHMCHHMLEGFPLDWAKSAVNVHLIRHPARVIASYLRKRQNPTLEDIGFARQTEIAEALPGPIINSADVRRAPQQSLQKLCAAIGMPWSDQMLSWPAGPKPYDGVWGQHWYNAVHVSNGFSEDEGPLPEIDHPLLSDALEHYETLKSQAL